MTSYNHISNIMEPNGLRRGLFSALLSLPLLAVLTGQAVAQTPNVYLLEDIDTFAEEGDYEILVVPTRNLTANLTVNYTIGGTATPGTDYTISSGADYAARTGTFTIPSGAARFAGSVAFTITPISDNIQEGDETIVLTLVAGTGYGLGFPYERTMTLIESTGDASFEVSGAPAVGQTLAINQTADDPDGIGTIHRYLWQRRNPGGEWSNLKIEGGGQRVVGREYVVPARLLGQELRGQINYVDGLGLENSVYTPPVGPVLNPITDLVQMRDPEREVAEFGNHKDNGGVRTVVEIGDGLSPKGYDRTINYTVDGSAIRGDGKDYTINGCTSSTCSVRLPANRHSVPITINVNNDGLDENDETIELTLKDGSGYTVNNARNKTTVTIRDDDTRGLDFRRSWADVKEGDSQTYTVKLRSQPTAAVTVKIISNNQDVTVSPTSLTFNPSGSTKLWSRTQEVTVSAAQDGDAVDDTATLTHTTSGGDYGGANALSIDRPISVDDDDTRTTTGPQLPRISLTGGSAVTEGAAASFTVNADPAPTARLTVNVEVTELPGQDFVAASQERVRTVTLNAGATSATFTVPTVNDGADEDDGYVQAFVNDGTGYVAGEGAPVLVLDNDDPIPAAFFRSVSSDALESGGTHGVQVDLNYPAPAGGLTLRYRVSGTATAGSGNDFTLQNSGTLSIAAGGASATIPVAINDDSAEENSETVILTLTGGTGYTVDSPSVHTLTIADNDSHSASFAAGASSVAEDAGTHNVTVNLSQAAPAGGLTLSYTVAGTATAGSGNDFTIQNSGSLSVAAGATSADIAVAINDDSTEESDETVILTLTGGTGYKLGSATTHTLTITASDQLPISAILAPIGGTPLPEGAGFIFNTGFSRLLRVNETVTLPLTIGGTARLGTDYRLTCGSVPGAVVVTCSDLDGDNPTITFDGSMLRSPVLRFVGPLHLEALEDNTTESNETVKLALGGSARTITITITDTPSSVALSFTRNTFNVNEDDSPFQPVIRFTPASGRDLTIPLIFTNVTATSGADYTAPAQVVFEANGSTRHSFDIPILDDTVHEGDETFTVAIDTANLPAGFTAGAHPSATVTIVDNDPVTPPTTPSASFAAGSSSAAEDAGTRNVTVNLSAAAPSGGLTLNYSVGGTATAGSGNDFTIQGSGTLSVTAGSNTANIPVAINDDSTEESDETVILTLTGGTGYTLGSTTVHTLTITDNDTPTNACVSSSLLADVKGYAGENRPNSPDHVERWSRVLAAFGESNSYGNNPMTATEAQTYADRGWNRWIPVVTALECLEGPTPPDAPVVSIAAGDNITEGGKAQFKLTADPAPASNITVAVQVKRINISGPSGQTGSQTVTIGTSGTASLNVGTTDDSNDWPDGTVYVAVQEGTGYTVAAAPDNAASVSVADNDATPGAPELSVSDATVEEGFRNCISGLYTCMKFTVTLSKAPAEGERVDFIYRTRVSSTGSRLATSGQDYAPVEGQRVFKPGDPLTKTIEVHIYDDNVNDSGETFELVISHAYGANIADAVGVGTITNDDPLPTAFLGRFGRGLAEQAVGGITARLKAGRTPGFAGQFLGHAPFGGDNREADNAERARALSQDRAPAFAGNGVGGMGTMPGGNGLRDVGMESSGRHGAGMTTRSAAGQLSLSAPTRTLTLAEALAGSAFTYTREADETGGSFGLWGRGMHATFNGSEGTLNVDGTLTTGLIGADYARADWQAGLAVLLTGGKGRFRGETGHGTLDTSMTAFVPYAAKQAGRLSLWGAAGVGLGEMTLSETLSEVHSTESLNTDMGWQMAAGGVRSDLGVFFGETGPELALVGDAQWTRTTSDKTRGLRASEAQTTRLRVGVEGGWSLAFAEQSLRPTLEAGVRYDAGDAETGLGVDVGAALSWEHTRWGLAVEFEGRTLILHEAKRFTHSGFSASLTFDPDLASLLGPSLTLTHRLGGPSNGGMDALFAESLPGSGGNNNTGGQWQAEAAYGMALFRGRFIGAPTLGYALSGQSNDYRLGWQLTPAGVNSLPVSAEVGAMRREMVGAEADHGVTFNLRSQW